MHKKGHGVESTQLRICSKKERSIKAFRLTGSKYIFDGILSHILSVRVHGKVKLYFLGGGKTPGISTCWDTSESCFTPQPDGKFGFLFLFFLSRVVAAPTSCGPSSIGRTTRAVYALKSTDDDKPCDKLECVWKVPVTCICYGFLLVGCCVLYWGIPIATVVFFPRKHGELSSVLCVVNICVNYSMFYVTEVFPLEVIYL